MKFLFSLSALAFFMIVLVSCGQSNSNNVPDSMIIDPNTNVAGSMNGQSLFEAKCSACHGADGKAGIMGAYDLTTSTVNHEGMVAIIKNGRNAMKAFANELTPEEIEAVANYASSLKK